MTRIIASSSISASSGLSSEGGRERREGEEGGREGREGKKRRERKEKEGEERKGGRGKKRRERKEERKICQYKQESMTVYTIGQHYYSCTCTPFNTQRLRESKNVIIESECRERELVTVLDMISTQISH